MQRIFLAQGLYFFLSGIWPLLHLPSFLAVTGEKTDLWLVQTVGALIAVTGYAFLKEYRSAHPSPTLAQMALLEALALFAVDVYFSLNGTISKIYLGDAVIEGILVIAWVITLKQQIFRRSS